MKIIEISAMPDGTEIQLEDWHDKNTKDYKDLYGYVIGVYPVAKNSGRLGWVKSGEKFRISISYNKFANYTDEMVLSDFEALKNGEKTLLTLIISSLRTPILQDTPQKGDASCKCQGKN